MAKTKIEPVIYLKITLPNGIAKYCKTVSQAARFYADEMTRRSKAGQRQGWYACSNVSERIKRDTETRYRRSYTVFEKILPRKVGGKIHYYTNN